MKITHHPSCIPQANNQKGYCDHCKILYALEKEDEKLRLGIEKIDKTLTTKFRKTESFKELFKLQGGQCAICKKPVKKLSVDHDHFTKKIRGLLCPNCNFGLGFFKDNRERLKAAIEYLDLADTE